MIEATGGQLMVTFDWLNGNASLVSALATVAIAWLTFQLARENRRLRQSGQEPQVVAYLLPHPDGNGAINIVFANVGLGLAKDVVFSIDCNDADFKAHRVLMKTVKAHAPINVIPSGEKIVALFGLGVDLFGSRGEKPIGPLKPFSVKITCKDVNGRQRNTISNIDVMQFAGLSGFMAKPPLRSIEDTLKKMDRRFEVLAKASKKFVSFVDTTSMKDEVRQFQKVDAPEENASEASK
ncbi:hypothetical protein EH32_11155 [Erythrobacter litoralis]|uniref:Uncharacterized protein n=2 Tax=Erythrobacter litoralis TaxID=39960 RepID=A0A074MIE8_9SPHN|nr:hypothetical protein EH32_11155 [Erythrobacter litoralis]